MCGVFKGYFIVWYSFGFECITNFLFQLSIKLPPKPQGRANPKPTRSGFLGKLSGGKHHTPKWDNRYFELTDTGYLNYYKKADGGKPINSIYLRGCPLEIDPNDPLIVLIKTDDREWSLRAATAEEAYAWKEAMSFYTDKRNWRLTNNLEINFCKIMRWIRLISRLETEINSGPAFW